MNVPKVGDESDTDIRKPGLSKEAMQLANQLQMTGKLLRLAALRKELSSLSDAPAKDALLREIREIRQDLCEIIEQARLEIDYVRSELYAEEALHNELLQAMMHKRDERVLKANRWAFRSNAVLWSVTEAATIPTYKNPRFAVPSGIVGILAGVVPSVLSELALMESKGHMQEKESRPNMLCKIFNYPVVPRVDYPESVWNYLQSPAQGEEAGKSRIDILVDQWIEDRNLRILTDRSSRKQLDTLTGVDKQMLSIDLLSNRVSMLTELEALVALMNRPLLELIMAVRGQKELSP